MIGGFQDAFKPSDVKMPENEIIRPEPGDQSPGSLLDDLKNKLEKILDVMATPAEDTHESNPYSKVDPTKISLEDGTVIDLPDGRTYENVSEDIGKFQPNATYEVDGNIHTTDDSGTVYLKDGELQPNIIYELNGNIYTTDEQGRIIHCEARPEKSPENPRDIDAQNQAGGADRLPSDQGGHIVGRDLNGDGGAGNLVAMDSKINQSDYKKMENDIKAALDEGKDVRVTTDINYSGDSKRPDIITATVSVDGVETVYKFDNNLEGGLMNDVPENGKEAVQEELNDTHGEISSIKEEYDENGNLTDTTVNITYTDENGTNYRTQVHIDAE